MDTIIDRNKYTSVNVFISVNRGSSGYLKNRQTQVDYNILCMYIRVEGPIKNDKSKRSSIKNVKTPVLLESQFCPFNKTRGTAIAAIRPENKKTTFQKDQKLCTLWRFTVLKRIQFTKQIHRLTTQHPFLSLNFINYNRTRLKK